MIKSKESLYVTRPIIPEITLFQEKIKEIWDSKIFSNQGKQHQLLEIELKKVLNVPNISLFNNGTIALMSAIQCLGLKGEVITTPFTFAATPHALTLSGITPVFCDIKDSDYTIDVSKIESIITPKTSAILGVHVFGNPCDVQGIQDIADKHNLKIIYDGAHSFQTEINNIGIGNFGDITMFSFHPTKLFHTSEGGALTYKDELLKNKIELFKNFGIKNEEEVAMPGLNGKLSEIQAALGLVVLTQLEEERKKREVILDEYKKRLFNLEGISFYTIPLNVKNSLQYFQIRIDSAKFGKSRDTIYEKMREYNIFSRKYFYPLCSNYPCYQELSSSKNLPVAKKLEIETLCLPFYGDLKIEEVHFICDALLEIKKG